MELGAKDEDEKMEGGKGGMSKSPLFMMVPAHLCNARLHSLFL